MFLKSEAETAIKSLNSAQEHYNKSVKSLTDACLLRYEVCSDIKGNVQNGIAHLEKRINATLDKDKIPEDLAKRLHDESSRLAKAVEGLDVDVINVTENSVDVKTVGTKVAAVAGAGAAISTLGPTAAISYATTFGVASTGTAISSLSGAAATNATLAYLGFGGGMAAGEVFLGLAGPIGWGIAAVGVIGGGIYFRGKNKKTIENAAAAEKRILKADTSVLYYANKVKKLAKLNKVRVKDMLDHIEHIHRLFDKSGVTDSLVKELYLLESNMKQLTAYVKQRLKPIKFD